jgi:predicted transcriptional regulator
MNNRKASSMVMFRAPTRMLAALDLMAAECHQTRSSLIREAVAQRLAFYERHERQIIRDLQRQTDEHFGVTDPQKGGQ